MCRAAEESCPRAHCAEVTQANGPTGDEPDEDGSPVSGRELVASDRVCATLCWKELNLKPSSPHRSKQRHTMFQTFFALPDKHQPTQRVTASHSAWVELSTLFVESQRRTGVLSGDQAVEAVPYTVVWNAFLSIIRSNLICKAPFIRCRSKSLTMDWWAQKEMLTLK